MKPTLVFCFLLLTLGACKHEDLSPDNSYVPLRPLTLGVEPLPDGISLKWAPVMYFEEGMYGGTTPAISVQYEIYISESSEKELKKVAVVDNDVHEYILKNQPAGKTIYAQVKSIHPQFVSGESNVATTNTGRLGTAEILFPDNTPNIIFGSWGGPNLLRSDWADTWVITSSDGSTRRLKKQGSMPVLSPDGRYIAYLANINTNTSYATQLLIETVDSGIVQLLDTKRAIFSVEWSNDGQWLAYLAEGELWKVSLANGQRFLINRDVVGGGNPDQIDWSPDNSFIVTTQRKTIPSLNRYIVNLIRIPVDGGAPQTLLASDWRDEQPAFSPDGERLAFISYRSGYQAIWVMNLKTSQLKQVTGSQEQFYYINRLDWMNNTQLTYTAHLPLPVDTSLKKVSLP